MRPSDVSDFRPSDANDCMTFALEPSIGDPKTAESTITRMKTEKEQIQDLFYEKKRAQEDDPLPSEIFSPFIE